ncbi:MAG: hypothetical protein ABJD24_15075 [Acidimicrobiales bacterium]
MPGCTFDVALYTLLGTPAEVAAGIVVCWVASLVLVVVLFEVVAVFAVVAVDDAAVLLVGLPLATGVEPDITRTVPQIAKAVSTALAQRITGRRRLG